MKVEGNETLVKDCLTVGKYVEKLIERTGNTTISSVTIHYHLTENGDKLDYMDWCGLKLIIQNEKSESFTPGNNYGGRKENIAKKMRL